jgi:hypothetical protein
VVFPIILALTRKGAMARSAYYSKESQSRRELHVFARCLGRLASTNESRAYHTTVQVQGVASAGF